MKPYLVLIILIFCITTQSFGEKPMEVIYENDITKMDYIEGTEYKVKKGIGTLFAIPERNSVGTVSFNNAIIKINFDKRKLQLDYVMKDFLPNVNASNKFMPVFSDQYIAWSRPRSFVLIDYKKKQMITEYMPDGSIHSNLSSGTLIKKEKLQFLFLSGETKNFETKLTLFLCEFSSGRGEIVKTRVLDEDDDCILAKTSFIYQETVDKDKTLYVLDSELNKIDHPLAEFYNQKQIRNYYKTLPEKKELKEVLSPFVHPDLPFAIVNHDTDSLHTWVVTWNRNKELFYYNLVDELMPAQISPDGKWILFLSFPTLNYVLMPVDSDLDHYLGEPVLLKGFEGSISKINTWISDPLSFVISESYEKKLIKWDISTKNIKRVNGQ